MNMRLTSALTAALIAIASVARAEDKPAAEAPVTIINDIQSDSIIMIEGMEQLLLPATSAETSQEGSAIKSKRKEKLERMGGYRVQVFSDGNARTAKGEAQRRAAAIQSRFPGIRTYVTYSSPYWKVRVGDFRTSEEAAHCAAQIRSAFPSYGREVRVTRDRVTATR